MYVRTERLDEDDVMMVIALRTKNKNRKKRKKKHILKYSLYSCHSHNSLVALYLCVAHMLT